MKKKVEVMDNPDRHGLYPIIFTGYSVREINEYLWSNYQGYRFVITFDETKDEYEPMEEITVYFLADVLPGLAYLENMEVKT